MSRCRWSERRDRSFRSIITELFVFVLVLIAGRNLLRRATDGSSSIPLSSLTARWRVGADYLDRTEVDTAGVRHGQLDSLDVYARSGFEPERIHPEVRDFYERTGMYTLAYDVTWHRGFRIGAALASRLTSRIEQLNLPGPYEPTPQRLRTLNSRFVELDDHAGPLSGSRAWIRTDPTTGDAVFVAIYAFYRRDGITYENVAVPLPWTNLSTVLHLDTLGSGSRSGLELTTRTGTGDEGLYLRTPVGAVSLPLDQTFRVWTADMPGASRDITGGRATIVATHEMWVWGRKFLTVDYAGWIPDATDVDRCRQ